MKKMTSNVTAISLFSGLGGDSLGLEQAGCKVIAYNELKPLFCTSHDANFPDSELIHEGRVHDISKLKDETFVKYKGKTDIINEINALRIYINELLAKINQRLKLSVPQYTDNWVAVYPFSPSAKRAEVLKVENERRAKEEQKGQARILEQEIRQSVGEVNIHIDEGQ